MYVKKFVDIEFFKNSIRNNEDISKEKIKEILHTPKEMFYDKFIYDLNQIKKEGKENNIKWNEIQFADFTHDIVNTNSLFFKKYKCMLYFKMKNLENIIYGIEVNFYEIENKLHTIEIDDLKIIKKKQ